MEFSELALQKVLQLFPELTNFIITFRDVTEDSNISEESAVKVGIFILQFGNGYFYLPVIAKGDAVQPIDSIFSVEDNAFYPLTKRYVTQAINSVQLDIGKPTRIPNTITKNPSVYDMVTPPRTGKFVYASSSRLVEFLGALPNMVKKSMLDKFSSDKDIYSALHKLFGLENIFAALKPVEVLKPTERPAVEVITEGKGLENPVIKSILEKGYALRGENTTNRVAILANDFKDSGSLTSIRNIDAGKAFKIVTREGTSKEGFIPKRSRVNPQMPVLLSSHAAVAEGEPIVVLFENGEYAKDSNMIAVGPELDIKDTMRDFFTSNPPSILSGLSRGENFAMFSPELELISIYSVENISLSNVGVTVKVRDMLNNHNYHSYTIQGFHNCTTINQSIDREIFVPYNTLVVKLKCNIADSLETNINSAVAKLELTTLTALGSAVNMGYDGVEFSFNGRPIGSEVNMVKVLVIHEGIAPEKAESFIKQAKERKQIRIYLSKKADFEQGGDIPQYGNPAQEQIDPLDLQKGGITQFNNDNLMSAIETGDPQSVESTIISELLQVTNMKEYIKEYLPEIKETINKIGRTLFLTRINMEALAESHNANEINSFVSNLRNVYRLLGDNYIKLEQMVADSEDFGKQNVEK